MVVQEGRFVRGLILACKAERYKKLIAASPKQWKVVFELIKNLVHEVIPVSKRDELYLIKQRRFLLRILNTKKDFEKTRKLALRKIQVILNTLRIIFKQWPRNSY